MKKTFTFWKSLFLLFALIVGTSNVWGQTTSTLTFAAKCNGTGTAKLDDSNANSGTVTWTVTSDADESNFDNDRGIHYGTTGVAVTYIQLSTSSFTSGTISKIEVEASGNNSPSLSVTVDGNAFGTTATGITTSNNKYTFTGSATAGTIVVRLAKSSSAKKALYIKSVAVTYSSGGDSQDPSIGLSTTTINATKAAVGTTTIDVTYNNLTNYEAEVNFYESDGTTPATYDHSWMTAVINATTKDLDYSITENASFERNAYLKVYALGDEGEAESNLITVKQIGAIYTVNIVEPTNGTLVVMNGENQISDGEAVPNDATLTIIPAAAEGYRYKNWQYKRGSGSWVTNKTTTTYTMTNDNVQFRANFDKEYSVNWSINGNVASTSKYIETETIVFPNRPADVQGKKFVGWTATEITGTQTDAPTLIPYGTEMGTSDVTYYAVFADASGESSTATLTSGEISSTIAKTQMSYGTERTYNDTSDEIKWIATGSTDAAERPWTQLNNRIDAYFNVSKLNDDIVKNIEEVKLTISSATNSSGGITDITKHNPFVGTVCIESAAKGNPAGYYASSSDVSDYTVTIPLPVSLSEFYIQTTAAARVWGIELTTNNYTYSNYCTAVSVPATITLASACNDGGYYYGTYSNSSAFVVPNDLIVSEISIVGGKLHVAAYNTGAIVPANTGVMVSSDVAGDHTVFLTTSAGTSVLGNDNMLKPTGDGITADAMAAAAPGCTYYRLTMHNAQITPPGKIGFWWGATGGASFAIAAANKAYLAVPTGGSSAKEGFTFEDTTTGINGVEEIAPVTKTRKVVKNGRLVIETANGEFTIDGARVK